MFLLVSRYLIPKRYSGMALFPFILLRDRRYAGDKVFLNHERIHIRQQAEMLVVPFFIWYAVEYLLRLIKYRDKHKAYKNISFEREAYGNEENPAYLKARRFWAFLKYI